MNSSFFDANVLLETLLPGRKKAVAANRALASATVSISTLSVHLFVYFGRKEGFGVKELTDIVTKYAITPITLDEVRWAMANGQGEDFEDALQVASAVLAGCQEFVTLDRSLAGKYGSFIKMKLP